MFSQKATGMGRGKSLGSLLAATLVALLTSSNAMAANCIAAAAGDPNLNCTANDLGVSSVVIDNLIDGCTALGDTFTFSGRFGVASGSPSRYDLGFFVGNDGKQAYTGSCSVSIVPTTGGFPNLDQDSCGDYNGSAMLVPVSNVTSTCVDVDDNGFYDVAICTSWDNNAMPACQGPQDVFPSTKAKCNCQTVNTTLVAPRCQTNADCPTDNNPCTNDVCTAPGSKTGDAFGCAYTNNTTPCNDGQFCTTGDTCSNGTCTGAPRTCNDSNVCTTDSCNETTDVCVNTNNSVSCNDGKYCTTGDTCSSGVCGGVARDCNDSNVCTTDSCSEVGSTCVNAPNANPCDDGLFCTTGDTCSGGVCATTPRNCSDSNVCTTDTCNEATDVCVNTNNASPCDDGLFCTTGDVCGGGACNGASRNCGDSNVCTTDSCNETTDVCVNAPNTGPCDDGQFCTVGDVCAGGVCATTPRNCADTNVCTTDSCNEATDVCVNANNASPCDDGQFCTTGDVCAAGACGGAARNCSDSNVCTTDSCNEATDVCVNANNASPCDDGLFCTTGDVCSGGVCAASPRNCGDENVCTDDSCNEAADACVNANNTPPCDDGLFCTTGDVCGGGACSGASLDCGDENVCTNDSCSEADDVCVNAPNTGPCDDGLFCTTGDICEGGLCASSPLDCGDEDVCTDDSCDDEADACVNANNTSPCDDGLFCTAGDTCEGGECLAPARDCGDSNVCTDDSCDEDGDACVNAPNVGPCDDGLYCNGVDTCADSTCNHEGNPCPGTDGDEDCAETCSETDDNCQGNDPNGSVCDDGLYCTTGDACSGGICAALPRNCNDSNVCTDDSCDEAGDQCANGPVPDGTFCEDDDICTIDGECTDGQCISIPTVLGDLCPWIIVGRAGPRRDTLKLRTRDIVRGDICGGTIKVGNGTFVYGDIASGRESGDQMRLSPDTFVNEDIVTMGAAAKAKPGKGKLPHLLVPTSKLAGGTITPKATAFGVYDLTGNTTLAKDCLLVRTEAYDAAVDILDGLSSTQSIPQIRLKGGQSVLITATNPGSINMVDVGQIRSGRDTTIELNGANNPATAMVIRVTKKMQLGLRAKVILSGGLTPGNVLFYVQGKKCAIGNLATGAGSLFCANGRMKTGRTVVWTGTFYGAGNLSRFGNTNDLTYAPFLGF